MSAQRRAGWNPNVLSTPSPLVRSGGSLDVSIGVVKVNSRGDPWNSFTASA